MWGDVTLFSGRFDKADETYSGFPVYHAASGDLKVFFNPSFNRNVQDDDSLTN